MAPGVGGCPEVDVMGPEPPPPPPGCPGLPLPSVASPGTGSGHLMECVVEG